MADLFEGYTLDAGWDEVFESPGVPRRAYQSVSETLQTLSSEEFAVRNAALAHAYRDRGVTFDFSGEERTFPLDLVPRLIAAAEWSVIEAGVRQRVQALEAFLADVYGPGKVFEAGVIPRRLVLTSRHFHRQAHGIIPPNGVRVHVSGIDLVRDAEGRFRVLEDNVRTPSGVSYVIENRRAMGRVLPELFHDIRVLPVGDYPARLLAALQACAPRGVDEPTVVVMTPGVFNSAYFEHSLLARAMGVELVEGRDLIVRNGKVNMRTTAGEQPVHVIYRRVDDEFLDPVAFRPDSVVGCPGLLDAARAGGVTLANGVGNGVADDKLVYTYLPDLIRFYLREEPVLDNVDTYRLEDADSRALVLDELADLVVKPVDGSGGTGIVFGPEASPGELDSLRAELCANPRDWVAQRVVQLSTSPTFTGDRLVPRRVDLRPFAVNDGNSVWVLPGGLTRVALTEGSFVVNSSQGGGSKDTWVLAEGRRRAHKAKAAVVVRSTPLEHAVPREVGPLTGQQQQQQQGRASC